MLVDELKVAHGSGISKAVLDNSKRGINFPSSPSNGDVFQLTQTLGNKNPGIYTYNSTDTDWIIDSPDNSIVPYDISGQVSGKMTASAIISRSIAVRTYVLRPGFEGCLAQSVVGAAAQTIITIKRISRQGTESILGYLTFAAGNNVGTFSQNGSSPMYISKGESLIVQAPNPADSTLADMFFTLAGALA